MPSTYTASGGYELQATGENNNTWGVRLNTALTLLDERIDGVASTTVTGNYSITITNAVSSDGRNAVQVMNGTPAADFTVTLPARELNRWFKNNTGKTATITLGSGTTCTIRNGQLTFVYTDGSTGCWAADPTLDTIKAPAAAVSLNSQKITGLATGTVSTDGVNKGQMDTAISSAIASAVVNVPAQTGNSGKYLKTDGTTPSWDAIDISTADIAGTLPVANGGTGATSLTANRVLLGNGTGAVTVAGAGTAGQVLTSNGASAPTFQAAPSSSLVLLTETVISAAATVDFTANITNTYEHYVFVLTHVKPATDGVSFQFLTSTNGGSSYDSASYTYASTRVLASSSALATDVSTSAANIPLTGGLTMGNDTNENGFSGIVNLYTPSSARYMRMDWRGGYFTASTELVRVDGAGALAVAADVDAVRFLMSSGNIASGSIRLYGLRKTP